MYRILALVVLIFSLIPAAAQARQAAGSQSVTIGISLTIPPDPKLTERFVEHCVESSYSKAQPREKSQAGEEATCQQNTLTVNLAEEDGGVSARVIPI